MGYQRIGDYAIERDVEDGYEATHVLLPRRVRLSVMHPTFVGLKPVAIRMMREACILEALRHPGVPRVYEVGVLSDQRTQRPWVASELVEGEALLGARLSAREVLAVVRSVAEILAHAHARGVAHRGVRPDAIICGDGSRGFPLCLVNWGDARAPEANEDKDRVFADDLFALGLVADLVLASRTGAPAKLLALIEDLLAPNPMSRPSATEVMTRAQHLLDTVGAEPVPPPIPAAAAAKVRWTPPMGIRQARPTELGQVAVVRQRRTT